MATTTTLIVDDELDMRLLVRTVIELANDGLHVIGEAADGVEALRVFDDLNGPPEPDVVILDNRMPRLTGLEAAAEILSRRPEQKVILYSAHLDDQVSEEAARLGVKACVAKHEIERLPDIIRELCGEGQ